jgi:hypothetical protein
MEEIKPLDQLVKTEWYFATGDNRYSSWKEQTTSEELRKARCNAQKACLIQNLTVNPPVQLPQHFRSSVLLHERYSEFVLLFE